jgi:multiple inositol-polyphosphate phosphatase/2,3-bisphosphoglycerate 3-phosphatase
MAMRKFNFLLLLLILSAAVRGQQFLGTKTPYVEPGGDLTPPPAGYRPVFVNYVGRHGARFLTKSGADLAVLQVLEAADAAKGLTAPGERLLGVVKRLCALQKDQYERITLLGAAEQRAIGQRLLDHYPGVFTGKGLDVVVTYKLRTRQSADAFLQAFGGYQGAVHFSRKADSLDDVLRFYDLSPAYQRYKKGAVVKKALDTLDSDRRTAAMAAGVCGRLFLLSYQLADSDKLNFTDNLYDIYSVQYSLTGEIKAAGFAVDSVDAGMAFTREELDWEDFRSGAQDFLEKGPGRDPLGIQVKVAAPLLADLIRSTDAGHVDAVLRFTHAEAISPFASLLGIPEACVPAVGIYHYREGWHANGIIPLSANIQWIIYSNGKEKLVKVLLNEREVWLPVAGAVGPYYKWADLRAYCLARLEAVGARLRGDMLGYLRLLPYR